MSDHNSPFSFPYTRDDAVSNLEAGVALLSYWLAVCPELTVVRDYEDKIKGLAKKAEAKRTILVNQKQLDLKA